MKKAMNESPNGGQYPHIFRRRKCLVKTALSFSAGNFPFGFQKFRFAGINFNNVAPPLMFVLSTDLKPINSSIFFN